MSNPENALQDAPGARGIGSCGCPARKVVEKMPCRCQPPLFRRDTTVLCTRCIALAAPCPCEELRAAVIAEYIDQNSITCDCCQHVFIDVTAVDGEQQHCISGDSEGEGIGCAWSFHGDVVPRLEAERDDLRAQLETIKGPGYAQRLQDLEERADENHQLRAKLSNAMEWGGLVEERNEQLRADLAEALDAMRGIKLEADRKTDRFERAAAILAKHEATGGER